MPCAAFESLVGRYADDPSGVGFAERQALEMHLAGCGSCRASLEDQRRVAQILQARPPAQVSPAFTSGLAARLDSEPRGMLALANWRAWTVTLTPVAAGFVLIAWLGGGAAAPTQRDPAAIETFRTWTEANATGDQAAVFLQPATGDVLLEAVLTGAGAAAEERDAR